MIQPPRFEPDELDAMWHCISERDAAKWPALRRALDKLAAYARAGRRAARAQGDLLSALELLASEPDPGERARMKRDLVALLKEPRK